MNIEVRKPTEEEIKEAENWPTWQKEVSQFSWTYAEKETCYIISGKAEVETNSGEKAEFEAGDWVVFPRDLKCTWKIKVPINKKYKFGE